MEETSTKITQGGEIKIISFKVANSVYAVDILKINSIQKYQKPTQLPEQPDFIEGIINIRGEVVPVINLRKKFGFEPLSDYTESKILVVMIRDKKVGMIVDDISEVMYLTKDQLEEQIDGVGGLQKKFIQAIAKIKDGSMLVVIDPEKVLGSEEIIQLTNLEG
jgi:purine-binding chemotaxis protein CheW